MGNHTGPVDLNEPSEACVWHSYVCTPVPLTTVAEDRGACYGSAPGSSQPVT